MSLTIEPFLARIAACHGAILPGGRTALLCAGQPIGLISEPVEHALTTLGIARNAAGFALQDGAALRALSDRLAEMGLYKPHDELFDIRFADGTVAGQVDRGAIPKLGLEAEGIHVNGLVEQENGPTLIWIGHRSLTKRLDPGKLDHLVAGGISTGLTPSETLEKEAEEEAGIPPDLARTAHKASTLRYALERPEGLRRDLLHCYDLFVPVDFAPVPSDGEVAHFERIPLEEAFARVRDSEDFKFNVALVLIDLFLRRGVFRTMGATTQDQATLRNALDGRFPETAQ